MNKLKMLLFVLSAVLLPAFGLQAAEQPSFVGRYYLQGVREAGSELVLRTDGSYSWMLAYGNQDHLSEGRWSRQGDRIVLTATLPTATGSLVWFDTKQKKIPWSFEAEQALQEQRYLQQREQVLKACPFMDTADYASVPKMIGEPEPAKQEREQRAAKALIELQAATTSLEQAAAEAVEQKTEAAMHRAAEAMDRFQSAWLTAKEASWDAGRPVPKRPVLQLPTICRMPQEPKVKQNQSASWSRQGIGVALLDSTSGSPLRGLRVTFVLADGTRHTAAASGGIAVIPLDRQERVLSCKLKPGQGKVETLALPPDAVAGSIYQVRIDTASLAEPFFRELQLEIDGDALVWPATGGRYQR